MNRGAFDTIHGRLWAGFGILVLLLALAGGFVRNSMTGIARTIPSGSGGISTRGPV